MEIPKSIESAWKEVSKDGFISRSDYQKLVQAAAPNLKNEEFDEAELNFLKKLQSGIEHSPKQEGVSTAQFSLFDDEPEVNKAGNDGIPPTLKQVWKEVSRDGKITSDDFAKLSAAAAPNKLNKEFDEDEIKFLSSLKNLLDQNGGVINIVPGSETKENFKGLEVPDTLKDAWNKVSKDQKITANDYNSLVHAAAPNGDDTELDDKEMNFLKALRAEMDKSPNMVINLNPSQEKVSELGLPEKVIDVKDLIDVPPSLKQAWNEVSKDGSISSSDYQKLLKTALFL